VAGKENDSRPIRTIGSKPLDDLCRRRAPIDEIAKKDDDPLRCSTGSAIGVDLGKQVAEKIVPSVNVANRIKPVSARQAWLSRASAGKEAREWSHLRASMYALTTKA
jgi:hypothetical protein